MLADYIDSMGSDLTIVNAARVSFDKESCFIPGVWADEKHLNDKDTKLIHYLAKHNHFTPFTHATVTLRLTVPILVARQDLKHQVGFSVNEVSRRYVDSKPEFEEFFWRKRHESAKQGSAEEFGPDMQGKIDELYERHMADSLATYNAMLGMGICPEQARSVLPQSMMTSYYKTGSLYGWARAYKLRTDPHAQKEIQTLYNQIGRMIEPLFPVSWGALTK